MDDQGSGDPRQSGQVSDAPRSRPVEEYAAGIWRLANSPVGLAVLAAVIAVLGLFFWQRWDWEYKERFQRDQVLLDRRIALVDEVARDFGTFSSAYSDLLGAHNQRNEPDEIEGRVAAYDNASTEWFAKTHSYRALVNYYAEAMQGDWDAVVFGTRKADTCASWVVSGGVGAESLPQAWQQYETVSSQFDALLSGLADGKGSGASEDAVDLANPPLCD